MAIENLPLFSAQNKEEVKPPFHHENCPPHGRPFTSQEAHMAIMQKVNECVKEVNNFEHRVEESLRFYLDKIGADNQGFKDAIQESYNCFQETIRNEVNTFEESAKADYETFTGDVEARFLSLSETINSSYLELEKDLIEKGKKLSSDYVSFTNSVNLAFSTFKNETNESVDEINAKVEEAYSYMKLNLGKSVKDAVIEGLHEGEFRNELYQVFGNPERFRGAFTYAEITALSGNTNGDYAFSTTDGHYYKWADVAWYDLGSGDLIANEFLQYVDHNSYTQATHLNNLTLNVDQSGKVVTLNRIYDSVGLIFTPKRWTSVATDKEFNYGTYEATSKNGFTGAVVFNVANDAIEMREMNTVDPHSLFSSDDIILFCAFFGADNAIKYFTYQPLEQVRLSDTLNKTTCKIFKRVCCVGDSYTAGYIYRNNIAYPVNEDYAWPHYLSTATGNEWINCGVSGANVLTWQTHERGFNKAKESGKVQAYVIGLALNDSASGTDRYVSVGVPADIGTTAQTYYGGMSAIIEKLNELNPMAKIFVLTCPNEGEAIAPYNEAVRTIVNHYKTTIPVHCLDLYENRAMFKATSLVTDFTGGHYTPIGYEQFAEIIGEIMSRYINDHVADFQNVSFIECDTPFVKGETIKIF